MDVSSDNPVSINFELADFFDLSSRSGAYSKTIKIPGSKQNDKALSFVFNINSNGHFDRKAKNVSYIDYDGNIIIKGYARLLDIITDGINRYYEIAIFGDNPDWFKKIEGLKLSHFKDDYDKDIQILDYPHLLSNNDFGFRNNGDTGLYVFPAVVYDGTPSTAQKMFQYNPFFFIKPLLKKICRYAGYGFSSSFFSIPAWRDLIIGDKFQQYLTINDLSIQDNKVQAIRVKNQSPTNNYTTYYNSYQFSASFTEVDFTSEVDPGSNYDLPNHVYTAPFAGTYIFTFDYDYINTLQNVASADYFMKWIYDFEIQDTGGNTLSTQQDTHYYGTKFVNNDFYDLNHNQITFTLSLNKGDQVILMGRSIGTATTIQGSDVSNHTYSGLYSCDLSITIEDAHSDYLDYTNIKDRLPDIEAKKLVKNICQMFNLITFIKDGKIHFEQRDIFLKDNRAYEDWSEKLDIGDQYKLTPISPGYNRTLTFEYKEDSNDSGTGPIEQTDPLKNALQLNYGGAVRFIDDRNAIDKVSKVANIDFSATRMAYYKTYTTEDYNAMPHANYGSNIRILVYKGVIERNWGYYGYSGSKTIWNSYPYAYFIDLYNPSDYSLLFCDNTEIKGNHTPSDGLVTRYYGNVLNAINNGWKLTGYFDLSPSDIKSLDFSRPKLIRLFGNDYFFYLNKIEDYIPGEPTTVKCELISYGR